MQLMLVRGRVYWGLSLVVATMGNLVYHRVYSSGSLVCAGVLEAMVRWGEDCILLGGVFRNRRLHWSVGSFSGGVMQ